MADWFQKEWARNSLWQIILRPVSWLYFATISVRHAFYEWGVFKVTTLRVPVVVVGNINVGGTGKTPVVIYLVEELRLLGFKPGVVSRGYTTKNKTPNQFVSQVTAFSMPDIVGDEPLLIATVTFSSPTLPPLTASSLSKPMYNTFTFSALTKAPVAVPTV